MPAGRARRAATSPATSASCSTLLLNHVRLEPGEAIYLGAGNVHAYLRGTGVEIMANSDNVLRCGLTPKHIDVPELLRITDFASSPTRAGPPAAAASTSRCPTSRWPSCGSTASRSV